MRLLKQEVDLMPKDKRKTIFKARKEKLEAEHEERVIYIDYSDHYNNLFLIRKFKGD